MGQISQALGLGSQFEFGGKTYTIAPWGYEIQGLFERYLEAEAVKAARRMAQYLSDEEKRQLLADVNRDIASGVYTFGSDLVSKAIFGSLQHFEQLLYLCLRPNHPDVTPAVVKEIVLAQMEDVWQKMMEANTDPTRTPARPATPPADPSPSAPTTPAA